MIINTDIYDGIETVEFKILDTSRQKYFFPEIPKLRNKLIRRIEFSYSANIAYTPSGLTPISSAILGNIYLNLVNKGVEFISKYPARDLYIMGDFQTKSEIFN